ncbi:MAG: recombinase family protein [Chloroflexi bacterium]|nr:recombinase family protein [Chloroflexota bacterium]
MKAIGYFVEGAQVDGAERSLSQQTERFLAFCQEHGYQVAATFVDTKDAAEADNGFRQMLNFIERGDHGFVVAVVDGLGVLGSDLGRAALKMLTIEAAGATVYEAGSGEEAARSIVEQWGGRTARPPVSERVRAAMRRRAVRGEALGRPPYGYCVGAKRRLEIVPDEAVVVQYIFRLYLEEGLGIRRIAGRLNEEGIPTRRGGRWSMVSVRDILRNRAYLGTYSRFGVRIPDSHRALVSPSDFRKVQENMAKRRRGGTGRSLQPFLLSGLVFCGRCDNRMIGVSRRQQWTTRAGEERKATYRYYQCESRTNQNTCSYNTQREAELEARVRELLAEPSGPAARLQRAGGADAYAEEIAGEIERIEGRLRQNRRQVEALVGEAASGQLPVERMKAIGAGLAKDQRELEREVDEAKARLAAERSEAEREEQAEATCKRLLTRWDDFNLEERQGLLREVIDRIEVDGDEARLLRRH